MKLVFINLYYFLSFLQVLFLSISVSQNTFINNSVSYTVKYDELYSLSLGKFFYGNSFPSIEEETSITFRSSGDCVLEVSCPIVHLYENCKTNNLVFVENSNEGSLEFCLGGESEIRYRLSSAKSKLDFKFTGGSVGHKKKFKDGFVCDVACIRSCDSIKKEEEDKWKQLTSKSKTHEFIIDGKKLYYEYGLKVNWTIASYICKYQHMKLLVIDSQAKQKAVAEALKNFLALHSEKYLYTWMGLTDIAEEGKFIWESGVPLAYTKWKRRQPDNYGNIEDCVYIAYFPNEWDWEWNDYDCSVLKNYICEE